VDLAAVLSKNRALCARISARQPGSAFRCGSAGRYQRLEEADRMLDPASFMR
jgi:hypothetical protein